MSKKLVKTENEWRAQLTAEQFKICRRGGTERAFTGEHNENKVPGTYCCVCCDQLLFESDTKYDSGSGWPSFWAPAEDSCVEIREDLSHFMIRTEVVCSRCDAHLGHRFDDGPPPTQLRYCINSASLKFTPK